MQNNTVRKETLIAPFETEQSLRQTVKQLITDASFSYPDHDKFALMSDDLGGRARLLHKDLRVGGGETLDAE